MINYPYPRAFLRDTVTKDLLITDGVVTVNIDEYTITDDTVTITNPDLESESFELHQSLNSEDQLIFGSCESAYISFVFHPSTTISTLVGKTLKVYVIPDHHPSRILQLGVFKVQEDKLTNNRKARKVVAYDAMYDILNTDMADWYNEIAFRQLIPGLEPAVSMSAFRNFFLQYFQIEIEETTLVNDNIVLHKTINPDQLSGADIIKAICEINGVFGQITNEGKFRFVELVKDIREESEEVTDLEVEHYIDVEYADYDSKAITGVRIITNEDIQGLGSREEPKNFYVINGNFLIADYKGSALVGVAKKLLTKIINRYYQPLTVNAIGNPVHEVGDAIKVILTDGTELPTYILERTLKGIQGLRDTYTAQGEETAAESLNSTSSRYDQISNEISQATSQAIQTASLDFVETIRNIGFRLLDEPSDVVVEYDEENQQVELSWTDPEDIDTLEPVPCEWAGTVVVRKEGSAPKHRWDGTLIIDSTTRDEYSETPLVDDTVEEGKAYYYGIFPYHVALDDADNPIKHYRYTKVVGLYILENDDPYYRFVSNPDILIEKESLNVPDAEVVGTKTSEGLTYTFYDNDLVVITGTYTYNGGYIDLDWWDSLYSRKYAYLGFDLASGVAFTDIRTELVEEYILNVPTGTNEFEIEGSSFASENSLKYLQLLQPCRISSFQDNTKLIQIIGIKNIDTSYKTDMSYMFHNCNQLTNLDLKNFVTSSVTDMSYMIDSCGNLQTVDVSSFNTSNVTSMRQMFGYSDLSGMDKLDLSHFNVSNVNRMSGMFAFCKAKNIDLHGWNIQHNCNLEVMFINSEVETLNLNDWQLSSTWDNTGGMLQGCNKLQTLYCPQSITSYAVDLPKTMYDSNGNSYTTLPGGNITLYATNPAA